MSVNYQPVEETDDGTTQNEAVVEPPPIPFPIYTVVLIGAIGCVFAAQLATGVFESTDLAGFNKVAFRDGQYWRILTGAVLHAGPLHVVMNCYAFYSFGKIFEYLSARSHLPIVFLLAAIGGGVLSLLAAPDGRSVGASGGILGVIAYLAVYAFRRRKFVSPQFRKDMLVNIGFTLVFGLVLFEYIDNFGHIGGLIVGAVYAFVQIPTDDHTDPRESGFVADIAGLLAIAIVLATSLFTILIVRGLLR
jgi:membrane associated rhomboid family serine protease